MTSEQMVFWLNGYFELSGAEELNKDQVKIIKDHIKLVLTKVTPSVTIGSQWYSPSVPGTNLILTTGSYDPHRYPLGTQQNPQKFEVTCGGINNVAYCSSISDKLDIKSTETYHQKFDDMIDASIKTHLTC